MRKKFTTSALLSFAGMSATAISAAYVTWSSMCLGPSGTEYIMTGRSGNPIAATCSVYDYSKFFPGFEKKTDSLRDVRPIFEASIWQP